MMNRNEILGYSLFIVGLSIIIYTAMNIFMVFTGKLTVYPLFNFAPISLDATSLLGSDLSEGERAALQSQGKPLKLELISSEMINQSSNIGAHLILMSFLAGIGFRIASLGTQFLRPIIVKNEIKQNKTTNAEKNTV